MSLPPLPEPQGYWSAELPAYFTTDQMHAYAAAARLAALEEAALMCEARALGALQLGAVAHPIAHEMLHSRDSEAQCCAAAIRSLAIHIPPTCTDSGEK